MPLDDLKVVHVSPRVQAHGGIEALHARHRERLGVPQFFVALFDRDAEARPDYANLNFTWRTSLGEMRREFGRVLAPHAGSVVIYHNAWGLPFFTGSDGAARRVAFCHATPDFFEHDLPPCDGLLDGVLGVTPALAVAWPRMLPSLSDDRKQVLPIPVDAPADLAVRNDRAEGGEIVLGYAGRVVREHKRLDRLPEFLHALDAAGVKCRFEVLGEGPLQAELERECGGLVRFHGWTTKEDYWRVLASWYGMVFFSELEGGPHALLESMALGGLPFFPRIGGSLGDIYAPQVDARCHYSSGDMPALAAAVREIFAGSPEQLAALRAKAQAAVAAHTWGNYRATLTGFLARIVGELRVSRPGEATARFSDALPLGLVTRMARGLLRRS